MGATLYTMGLDIGSTTAKAVILDDSGAAVWRDYQRHSAAILPCVRTMFQFAEQTLGPFHFRLCVTGSAGMGFAERFQLPFTQEVIAASHYIHLHFPNVKTLVDVGGEDAKMIFFNEERPPDIRMNGSCAGGTGAFIDQMATLLNVSIEDLDTLAGTTKRIHPIASRCGVFAKTDVQNLISRKVPVSEISRSIFHAVALQCINSLARGQRVQPHIFFSGGPLTFIHSLRERFLENLGINDSHIVQTQDGQFLSALGAAERAPMESTILNTEHAEFLDPDCPTWISNASDSQEKLFESDEQYRKWQTSRRITDIPRGDLATAESDKLYLGIDAGSTTTKIVVLDEARRIVFSEYANNNGNTLLAVSSALDRVREQVEQARPNARIIQSAVTGYGEDLIRAAFNIDHGIVETIAHFRGAQYCDPKVSFILDIGGQDMKAIFIKHGKITRIEINEACSSGCGSFIQSFAGSLGVSAAHFSAKACSAERPCDLGTRCTVFMNSKVKQALRENSTIGDIAAGLAYSVIKNSLYKVLKLRNLDQLGDHIVVQGGTFLNDAVFRALEQITERPIARTNIPELMGAFGCALYAQEQVASQSHPTSFVGLENCRIDNRYKVRTVHCNGCTNSCYVSKFTFEGNRRFYTGNKCEDIYFNRGEKIEAGENLLTHRSKLLFDRVQQKPVEPIAQLGIPRILAMYEQFPFWHTLFTECGIEVVLSDPSSQHLYELGTGAIMSDNICFPAKVAHGHVENLIAQGLTTLFYPLCIYERREQDEANNSYNCPIVASYAEVLRGTLENSGHPGIRLDSPTVGFHDEKLLKKACWDYLSSYEIQRPVFKRAFNIALAEQRFFTEDVESLGLDIYEKAWVHNRPVVVLAGHPYHNDPMIENNTSRMLSGLGMDVLTVDALTHLPTSSLDELFAITQWTYPNRLFHAAQWVAEQEDVEVHFVMLTSFGCGPDAFLIDEIKGLLEANGKTFTLIKVDEIASPGSIRLRLRSLVESIRQSREAGQRQRVGVVRTPRFMPEDKQRTILFPHFSKDYSPFFETIFKRIGYKVQFLPPSDSTSAQLGLKYANNEICYPATVVVGDVLKALFSGDYDPAEVAVGISQTGGQCRATNYIALLRQALVTAGYPNVPVVATAMSKGLFNEQPGFKINVRKIILPAILSVMYIDAISQMYYSVAPRECIRGSAGKLKQKYIQEVQPLIEAAGTSEIFALLKQAVQEFNAIPCFDRPIPRVGIVGEIYLKYNEFSNAGIYEWLVEQGVEIVLPPMLDFLIQSFVNTEVADRENLKRNKLAIGINGILERLLEHYQRPIEQAMHQFRFTQPEWSIHQKAEAASKIISLANKFGEGWLIPAEISEFAERGINNVVSMQPFGCIANHIIAKGIETKIKAQYPKMNLLFLDFDADVSRVNIHNRLYFMIRNSFEEYENTPGNASECNLTVPRQGDRGAEGMSQSAIATA